MKLQVIVGSVRENRVTDKAAKWVANEAGKLADTQAEVVDLIDYPMPMFNEGVSPRYNPERKPIPEVKKWLDKVAEADAYVFVTAEYNRSMPAVLKNAIDYLDYQIEKKPVLLVGHGSAGGAQAVGNLREAFPGVGAVTIPKAVYLTDRPGEIIDDDGNLNEEVANRAYGPQNVLQAALEELKWYNDALAASRAKEQ
jgi:NAD(P)H-dependent FMN reductase